MASTTIGNIKRQLWVPHIRQKGKITTTTVKRRFIRCNNLSHAMLIVNISTPLAAGVRWDVADDGLYCTNDVPLQPSYLHSAYCFNHNQLVRTWGEDTTERPPRPPPLARSQQHQHSPPTMSSTRRLITASKHTRKLLSLTPPLPPSLSYPWSSLVLDLKDLLPILDRYVLCCLLASSAATGEPLQNDQVLTPLLKTLAQTVVNIISPQASLNTRPVLPKEI